ncbi:DUF2812 domain-containing protein [Cohnella sp.]|uniref:DUF2812 domain-containing protein n=1 Tax=Cohnella sp. TaxID=1883426 RepID=UPI0035682F51
MKRFKLFRSYQAEEKWLSEQAETGWRLVKKGLFYTFRKHSPQRLVYSVDYRTFKTRADYNSYLSLFSDAGWTHTAGSIRSGEQYFTAPPQQGEELSIFSDKESSHSRYTKKAWHSLLKALLIFVFMILSSMSNSLYDISILVQPSRAFLTPGIWEKTGGAFWQAFFFELPFASLRIGLYVLLIGYVLLFAFYAAWALICEKLDKGIDNKQLH